ncbi:hypothetical protein HU200_008722 [Digitaria exilis]|uniref:Protein kinase domain-containing protein n=1 Tax=Digitaria exilis TaxID=1010633 RepID=A0A835KNR6_9POAL|nr:hypothetical protein HU200_008722 [Digitaria exilis]
MTTRSALLSLGILLLPLLLSLPPTSAALSPDGQALLAFKAAVTDDPTGALASWSDTDADPCRWVGITCANASASGGARVVGVAVAGKNLSGVMPPELGNLALLRRLNLHGNRLTGTIPPALANATSLRSLFLYDNRLSGPFPAATLCALPRLQNLDLSRNALVGPLPEELARCSQLERLLLAENQLSGNIPAGVWPQMAGLQMLDLSSNNLTGDIPVELGKLPALAGTLNLSRNHLSGGVPTELGRLPATVTLDLRFNNLSGEIPQSGSLAGQGPTAFLNNPGLCGFPLQVPCRAAAPSSSSSLPPPSSSSAASSGVAGDARQPIKTSLIVLISVADAAGVALIGVIVVYVYWKAKDKGVDDEDDDEGEGRGLFLCCPCMRADACMDSSSDCSDDGDNGGGGDKCNGGGGAGEAGGELVAIDKGFKMELDELLRSSAYVLGKGGKGIVYKVVVGNGTTPVAVRRLGGGAAAPERYREFAAEAGAVGRVRHPNVVRLRAYYWSADEKLVVTDFVNNGNLATALRGRSGQPSLSWSLRLRIAKGAARGLAHLHECSPRRFVHGEVKPSNILLDADYNALVADFGLARLLNIAGCTDVYSVAGSGGIMGGALPYARPATLADRSSGAAYRAPEARAVAVAGCARSSSPPSQKADVYSFGVVLLELLTGRAPEHGSPSASSSSASSFLPGHGGGEQQEAPELVRWVRRGFEDARPLAEMADEAVLRDAGARKEVIAAFHVALGCVEADPERRPRMKAVSDSLDKIGA